MKNYDEIFQERVDELLLLEQRIERRSDKFIEITNNHQANSREAQAYLVSKIEDIGESLNRMNTASDSVHEYVTLCAKHASHTTKLFLGSVIAAAVIVAGTLWWSHHINDDLADAKAELLSLNTKLKHTPMIMRFHGKDYVRVVPDSETGFTRGDDSKVPGRYAEMWHVR